MNPRWAAIAPSTIPFAFALLVLAASLTPSLIPRDALLQGALSGVAMAIGYMIAGFFVFLWVALGLPRRRGRIGAVLGVAVVVVAVLPLAYAMAQTTDWQNSVRGAVGLEPVDTTHAIRIVALAGIVFAVLFAIGRLVRLFFDLLRRRAFHFLPPRAAGFVGVIAAAGLIVIATRDGIVDPLFAAADTAFATAAAFFEPQTAPPDEPTASGGPGSLLDWGAMGERGRAFVASGPDADAIAAFTGRPAKAPLRVYVGREEADGPEARAALAVRELARVGAFERAVLIVTMPTGTGWLDPGSHDPVEYLLEGDVATVAVQYSYLTSPLALIAETRTGLDQAVALTRAVVERWQSLDKRSRPRLYLHGLSLGAWSSMYSLDLFAMVNDPIDGALWAGPPFPSELWQRAVRRRDAESAYVKPVIDGGRLVRVFDQNGTDLPADGWGNMRIAFLQYASDAIVFFRADAAVREPQWMREPPAFDVSPKLYWLPGITTLQLALDMAIAKSVPPGYGHNYIAEDYIPAWHAVLGLGWSVEELERLTAHCAMEWGEGCRN